MVRCIVLENVIKLKLDIPGDDLSATGEASSTVKKMLNQLGIIPSIIKKATVSMYEAELNAVIHANGGRADVEISESLISIKITDSGPGIPDVELAMKEGYSTASDEVREMGFGAGMGLPNMKRYADELYIDTKVGEGTCVTIIVNLV